MHNKNRYLTTATLIIFVGVCLRVINNTILPFSWLESHDLRLSHLVLAGEWFAPPAEIRKWLSAPLRAYILHPTGPETPWLTRTFTAILSALNISAVIAIGRRLGKSRQHGLLTGFFYILFPMALFFERTALVDTLQTNATTLILLFTVWLGTAKRPRPMMAIWLGIAFAVGYLIKVSTLPYLGLPAVAIVLLTKRENWLKVIGIYVLSLVIMLGLVLIPYSAFAVWTPETDTGLSVLAERLGGLMATSTDPATRLEQIQYQLSFVPSILLRFIGVGPILFAILAGIWSIRGRSRREIWFLLIPGVVFIIPPIIADTTRYRDPYLSTRYIITITSGLVLLFSLGYSLTVSWITDRWKVYGHWVRGGLLALFLIPALWLDAYTLFDPAHAPIPNRDQLDFITSDVIWAARDITNDVVIEAENLGDEEVWLLVPPYMIVEMRGTLGTRIARIDMLRSGDPQIEEEIAHWLAQGKPLYLADQVPDHALEGMIGLEGELVNRYSYPYSSQEEFRLFRVTGAGDPTAGQIFDLLAPTPEQIGADIGSAISTLDPDLWLVYPAEFAPSVESLTDADVVGLGPNHWPPFSGTLEAQLAPGVILQEGDLVVGTILIDEANTDPVQTVREALQNALHRTEQESWSGLVHVQGWEYVFTSNSPFTESDIVFEGGIALTNFSIGKPSDSLPISLIWETPTTIGDSFVVFTHIVDGDGNLVAQYDSVPGGGIYPMPDWVVNTPVRDQYVVLLPDDLVPGTYQVWIGIYHPASGLRLPVVGGESAGQDYAGLGVFER